MLANSERRCKAIYARRQIGPHLKNDVLFYVLYGVVIKLLGKTDIKPVDIVNIDLNTVSEEFIDSIKWKVYHKYKELGGDGRIAKSPNFITYIDKIIGDNE